MKYTSIHEYYILLINYVNYGFSILLLNMLVYLTLTLGCFLIFLVTDTANGKFINNLKNLIKYYFLRISLLTFFLSLAGIPPLLGFASKFMLVLYLFNNNCTILVYVFITLNVYILYFYLQNIRFFTSKESLQGYNLIFVNNVTDKVYSRLILIMFINIFGLFYFENLLISINYWLSYI